MLYNLTHCLQLLCGLSQSSASGGRRLSFLACDLLWPCSLIKTSDRVKWDSLIAKGFIFEVSSQSVKQREAEKMETRLALASILGPFLVYLLKFTLLTPFLHTFSSLS